MIVVGAGIIGLSCAWRLAQRGIRVLAFDAREAASEASWAGAGMLAPGGELEADSPLTGMALRSLALYPDFVEELREASGQAIDYQQSGATEVAFTETEAEALEHRAHELAALGIVSEAVPWAGHAGARFFPGDQVVAPRDVTAALRTACQRAGVTIREHEPVAAISEDGKSLRTAQGEYYDDGVLIAAGAWSSALRPGLPQTTPIRGHLIAWRPERALLHSILRHGHTYMLQRCDGTLIAGSSTEYVGFDRTLDIERIRDIETRAAKLLPALSSLAPVQQWNGFRPGIAGGVPLIGRLEDSSVWTAFGHYRNGILLAPETARLIVISVTASL